MNTKAKIAVPALTRDGAVLQKQIELNLEATSVAESRFAESQSVSPITYSDLEYVFNAAYRELKTNLSILGYEIAKAKEIVENTKAEAVLDHYPEFIKDKPKGFDNSATRTAFIQRFQPYKDAVQRVQELEMLEKLLDGKIKTTERVASGMRKQMDLIIKSGIDPKLYVK